MDKFKLKETIYLLVHKMLDPNDKDKIVRLRLDSHGIFSLDKDNNLLTKIIDTSSILDVEYMKQCIRQMCRIQLIGDCYRAVSSTDGVSERKEYEWSSVGTNITLNLLEFKVLKENREVDYEALDTYTNSFTDFTIATLELNGYEFGYYHAGDQSVFGVDKKGYTKKLASYRLRESGQRPLSFDSLGKGYDSYLNSDKTITTFKLPYPIKDTVSPEFLKSLSQTGIMVIQNMRTFNIVDALIKSKKANSSQVKVIQLGGKRTTLTDYQGDIEYFGHASQDFFHVLTQSYGQVILDQERRLTLEQVNKFSEDNLVIINTNDDSINTFYSQFDSLDESTKIAFTGRIRYFGNPDIKGTGIQITSLERELLQREEYSLVDIMRDNYTKIGVILNLIVDSVGNLNRVYNNEDSVFLERYKEEGKLNEPSAVKNISLTRAHLVDLLVNNLNQTLDKSIKVINSEEPFVGMLRVGVKNPTLLRVNIIPSHSKLPNVFISVIPRKNSDLTDTTIWESNLNIVVGRRGSGKTNLLRANIPERENVFIYDTDYEFSEIERDDYKCLSMVTERDNLRIKEVRQINPTLVIINSELDIEQLIPIMTLANRGMKVIISMTSVAYNILSSDERYLEAKEHYGFDPRIIIKKGDK